jgi:oligoribonuclease NrnB/cAMP/cGMP phosphodiesterase (DHH superfamily)
MILFRRKEVMKSVIVYHKATEENDCPDGVCGAYFLHAFLEKMNSLNKEVNDIEVVGVVHKKREEYLSLSYELPFNPVDKNIYIVDFSFPFEILERIRKSAYKVILLDHHKGNWNDISNFSKILEKSISYAEYSPNEKDCGATMAWKYCYGSDKYPWFLQHVFARDTGTGGFYDGDLPVSEAIGEAMSWMRSGLSGKDAFPVFDKLMEMDESEKQKLIQDGFKLLQPKYEACEKEINLWLENPVFEEIGGCDVPVLRIQNPDADRYYSWIGSLLSRRYPDIFVAIITTSQPNSYSLRANSKSNVDCSQIAKLYGGGGHAKAAGFIK